LGLVSIVRPRETEAGFQRAVIDLARLMGFRVAHFRAAQTGKGWRTPVQADGAGFPDLVMTRGGRIIAVELKAERGRVSDEQLAWLDALAAAAVETYVWRPRDWERVVHVLRQEPA
jgi:hypothetical protein